MIHQRTIKIPSDIPQKMVEVYTRQLVRDALYEVMHDCFGHGKHFTFSAEIITHDHRFDVPFPNTVIEVIIDIRETPSIDFTMHTLDRTPTLPPDPETVGVLLWKIAKILFRRKGKR